MEFEPASLPSARREALGGHFMLSPGAAHETDVWEQNIGPEGPVQGGRPWNQKIERRTSWKDWGGLQETGFSTAAFSSAAARRSPQRCLDSALPDLPGPPPS